MGMVFVRQAHKTMSIVSTIWTGATVEMVGGGELVRGM
jgi:hypothetical protein